MKTTTSQLPSFSFRRYLSPIAVLIIGILLLGCTNISLFGQSSVKLYPKIIRLQKGKTKSITAAAYSSPSQPVYSATFGFSVSNPTVVSISPAVVSGDDISTSTTPPPNLRTLTGLNAGTATITATWNGLTSNVANIIVDDPAATPIAIITGDGNSANGTNINTYVGEAIEVSAESSTGVASVEWNWGDGDKTTELLSATHAYLVAGTYTLRLTITNTQGQSSIANINVNVANHPAPTRIINVTTISQLVNAYNSATGGEHIVIPAGTVLTGEIVLPYKAFSDYVTIRSSGTMPDIRERISPNNAGLVTIRGSAVGSIPLTIKSRASKIRLIGLKFDPKYYTSNNGPSTYYLVQIGEAFTQTDVSQNPNKIIMQHCVINPPDDVDVVHAVLNDGYKVSLISNWIGNVKTNGGQDSQAVVSFDGRGAHVYHNNFFEAASENVMYGGAVPNIDGLVTTNIEFRRCYFSKRLNWRSYNGTTHPINVKNLFEVKNARRLYLESSVLENHWDALRSQLFALVFKSATSPGSIGEFVPWAISEDIVVENSKINHIYGGVTNAVDNYGVEPFHGLKPNGIYIKNTLFDDLSERWGASPSSSNGARLLQPNSVEDLQMNHVTMIDKDRTAGTAVYFVTNNNYRIRISNSLFGLGGYGIIGGGVGTGIRALNPGSGGSNNGCQRASNATWIMNNNVLPSYGADVSCYPSQSQYQNYYVSNYTSVGFVDLAGGNYQLASTSPYRNKASDGTDPGVNFPLLNQRTACSVQGMTQSCLLPPTAQAVSVTGRVVDTSNRGIYAAVVSIVSVATGERKNAITNPFGYFRFFGLTPGDYQFLVVKKNRSFNPLVRTVLQDLNDQVITSNP